MPDLYFRGTLTGRPDSHPRVARVIASTVLLLPPGGGSELDERGHAGVASRSSCSITFAASSTCPTSQTPSVRLLPACSLPTSPRAGAACRAPSLQRTRIRIPQLGTSVCVGKIPGELAAWRHEERATDTSPKYAETHPRVAPFQSREGCIQRKGRPARRPRPRPALTSDTRRGERSRPPGARSNLSSALIGPL